ncbi:MAG: hypothetical protein AB8G15_10630 [Saprospiraceae bacterium]
MKSKISMLMFLSLLIFGSCQKEDITVTETPQMDNIENAATPRGGDPAAILVHWGDNQEDPVQGARIFNMETNELIAETNGEGVACVFLFPGKYRVVDPAYGVQQAVVKYPEDFEYEDIFGKRGVIIAWGINGEPIYE